MNRMHRRRLIQAAAALGLAATWPASAAAPAGDDMSMGAADAKVTVIEYGSASCTHCARFNNDIFPAFKAKYVDTGRVRYVFREFLTDPVTLAAASFLLARCAGKDKYFSVLDAVFHAQAEIYKTGDADSALRKIAQDAGLSEAQANACLSDKAAIDALNARVKSYIDNDKVTGTPTFFIDGERMEGVQTLDKLDAAIARAEARAALPAQGSRTHRTSTH